MEMKLKLKSSVANLWVVVEELLLLPLPILCDLLWNYFLGFAFRPVNLSLSLSLSLLLFMCVWFAFSRAYKEATESM